MSAKTTDLISSDRRRLLRSGASVGMAGAVGLWPASADAAATGDVGLADFRNANIDWRAYRGQTLVLGSIEHPWTTAATPMIPLFEQLTGITVRVLKQSEPDYVAAMPGRMATRSTTPDVLMIPTLGQYITNGWLAPLDPFYENRALFDAKWFNQADMFPAALAIPAWTDKHQYSQSITIESTMLFMNRTMLASAGLAAPQNFDELYRAAVRLKTPQRAGIALRCRTEGYTMWVLAGFIFSNGGAIMENDTCVFDSDAAATAIEYYVRILRDAGPAEVNHDWYEVLRDFGHGAAAMAIDSSSCTLELTDAKATPVSSEVAYAPMPGNGKRPAEANVWAWQAGVNAYSSRKEAAFLFLCFVNSPPGCRFSAARGLATPRASAWESAGFRQRFGDRAAEAAAASNKGAATTKFKATWLHPKSAMILDGLAKAVFDGVTRGGNVRETLKTQAAAVNLALAKK